MSVSDLISRQAAVDTCQKHNGRGFVWASIMNELEALPSAVVFCKDCKYWKERSPVCNRINKFGYGATDFCSKGERKNDDL